jgi:RNA polymerase sigma factor (sigma-70 family)
MLHHHPHYTAAIEAERRARASTRRPPAGAGELDAMVLGATRGDDSSWNALVARFTARVRAVARRHGLAPHDVDDVLQTTWLRLFQHVGSVREPAALSGWLDTTARRESLRVVNSTKRERPTDEELEYDEVAEPIAERELVAAERRLALAASLERLPSRQRTLIGLLLADPSLSYAQIAKTLDTPIGSIGPTRARSLERLRRDPELMQAIGHGG